MIFKNFSLGLCACTRYKSYFNNNLFHNTSKKSIINLKPKYNIASYSETVYNVNTNVVKDVILYKYENPKFFKMLNLFALCQFGFWTYLSHFAYTGLRNVTVPKNLQNQDTVWWRKINLGEKKYRIGLTTLSFALGYGILVTAWMFTLKSVRFLVLRKGGQAVTFVTYGPFGKNRMMTVNLKNITCKDTRGAPRPYLPIKVKNHFLHYMLDTKGEFKNGKLFDYTAGLKRTLN